MRSRADEYHDFTEGIMSEKLTPVGSVRAYCTQCLGMNQLSKETVKDCQGDRSANRACPFYPYRMGKRISVRIFRAFCLQCAGGSRNYVEDCPSMNCHCYPYRFGKNPARKGQGPSAERLKVRFEQAKERRDSTIGGRGISGAASC